MGESLSPWLKGGSPGSDAEGSPQENADLGLRVLRSRDWGTPLHPQSFGGPWGWHRDSPAARSSAVPGSSSPSAGDLLKKGLAGSADDDLSA